MNPRISPVTGFATSVVLHGIFVGGILLAARYGSLTLPTKPIPADVEIIPSVLIDKGNTDLAFDSSDESPAPWHKASKMKLKVATSAPAPAAPPQPDPLPAVQLDEEAVALPASSAAQPGSQEKASPGSAGKNVEISTDKWSDVVAEEGGSYAPPGYQSGERPIYPAQARREGWWGTVTLRILVNTSGTPAAVTIRVGSGYEALDEAAVLAVKKWRFSPAKKGGQPIVSYHDVRVRFRLEDAR
jgi:protein TonB